MFQSKFAVSLLALALLTANHSASARFISEDPMGFEGGDVNFYVYAGNDPVDFNDPTGHAAETPWDLFNVGLGSYSLTSNLREGNWGWAALDAAGLLYDGVATAVPFLPAGASAGISALRAGNTVINSAQVAIDVARVANVANDAARAASTTGRATDIGRAVHNQVGNTLDNGNLLSRSANNYFRGANGATGPQPDLSWGNASGIWADLTTQGQWSRHVNNYSVKLGMGEGVPLIYEAGKGLDALQLYSGASSGLTALQFGTENFFGEASANGGFLLYPNKANLNMMRSVYQK